jgi:hypothetical protein
LDIQNKKLEANFEVLCFVKLAIQRSGYLVLGENFFCFFRVLLTGLQELFREMTTASQRLDKESSVGPPLLEF